MESEEWLFNILFEYFFVVDKNENVLKAGTSEQLCFTDDYDHIKYVFQTDVLPVISMVSAPHILRHARCSHKIKVFGYTLQELFEEMKWGNLNQALTYSHQDNGRQDKMKKLGVISEYKGSD